MKVRPMIPATSFFCAFACPMKVQIETNTPMESCFRHISPPENNQALRRTFARNSFIVKLRLTTEHYFGSELMNFLQPDICPTTSPSADRERREDRDVSSEAANAENA